MPAGQLLQPACDVRSVASLQVPASHGSGTLAPSPQKWPTRHAAHAVAPSASAYVPPLHLVHAPALATDHVPAEHASSSLAPVGQKEPAAHGTHAAAPAADEYDPAAQSVHMLLCAGAYSPAAHCSGAVAAVGHAEPAGQLLQPTCDVRSVASLQVPASHGSGTLVPSPQ